MRNLGKELGIQQEEMIFYGRQAFPGAPELLAAGVVEEIFIGRFYGIKPGILLLIQDGCSRADISRLLAGVLERDENESEKFHFRHFLASDFRVPWLRIWPEEGGMSEQYPYRVYWDFGGGGKESLGYRHLCITAARWQEMKAFFDKWLPAPAEA